MLYVGVDAHKASSQITVVDEDGRAFSHAPRYRALPVPSERLSLHTMSL
jgi:hypothetical protein